MKLPAFTKKYFWDVDFSDLNFRENPEYVTARLLEYGDVKALKWLFGVADRKKLKQVVKQTRQLSPKSCYFWTNFFNINQSEPKCLKKSYQKMRKSHWPY